MLFRLPLAAEYSSNIFLASGVSSICMKLPLALSESALTSVGLRMNSGRSAIAASTEPAVMSCIFIFAICSTCFRVTFPTCSLPGLCAPEPFFFSVWRPAAFLRRIAAGGVLSWNVKERSA